MHSKVLIKKINKKLVIFISPIKCGERAGLGACVQIQRSLFINKFGVTAHHESRSREKKNPTWKINLSSGRPHKTKQLIAEKEREKGRRSKLEGGRAQAPNEIPGGVRGPGFISGSLESPDRSA